MRPLAYLLVGVSSFLALRLECRCADEVDRALQQCGDVPKAIEQNLNPSGGRCPSTKDAFDPCTDLFAATCMNPDGTFKTFKLEDEAQRLILQAREATLKKLGQGSLEDAVIAYLKNIGYQIRDGLTDDEKKKLLSGDFVMNPYDFLSEREEGCGKEALEGSPAEREKLEIASRMAANDIDTKKRESERQKRSIESAKKLIPDARSDEQKKFLEWTVKSESERLAAISEELKNLRQRQKQADAAVEGYYSQQLSKAQELIKARGAKAAQIFGNDPTVMITSIVQVCQQIPAKLEQAKKDMAMRIKESEDATKSGRYGDSVKFPRDGFKVNDHLASFEFPKAECSKELLYSLRKDGVDYFRAKDSSAGKEKAAALVARALPILTKLEVMLNEIISVGSETVTEVPIETTQDKRAAFETEIGKIRGRLAVACHQYTYQRLQNFREDVASFFKQISKAKPTVDFMLGATFNDDQKKIMAEYYKKAHAGIMNFIRDDLGALPSLKNSAKYKRIVDSVSKLDFAWPKKPGDSLYHKEPGFGVPVLDFDKLPPNELLLYAFQDPTLSYFRDMNAFYNPKATLGVFQIKEAVNLLPALNLYIKKDPYSALAVMAHEIGHKIGYEVSRLNGYDLKAEYAELLSCLRKEHSIHMQKYQEDEVLADWISAHVMSAIIAKLPESERNAAALRVGGFFCELLGDDFYKLPLNRELEAGHPEVSQRINGIFGANSLIRKHLGCVGGKAKGKYEECQLRGVEK